MPTQTVSPLRAAIEKHFANDWGWMIPSEVALSVEPDIEWSGPRFGHNDDVTFDGDTELVFGLEQFARVLIDNTSPDCSPEEAASVAAIKALLPARSAT